MLEIMLFRWRWLRYHAPVRLGYHSEHQSCISIEEMASEIEAWSINQQVDMQCEYERHEMVPGNLITDKVKVDSNVFHSRMKNKICTQILSAHIVTIDGRNSMRRETKL